MAEAVLAPDEAPAAPKARRSARDWLIAIGKAAVGLLLVLLVLAGALVAFLDTEPGHRLIVDRIGATIFLLDRPDGQPGLRARVIFPAGVHGQAGPRLTSSSP